MKRKRLVDFETRLKKSLHDPKFVEEYLNEALKDNDLKAFLVALMSIAKAKHGGVTAFAKETGYSRQTIYIALSEKGNPTFDFLNNFLNVMGLHLQVEAIKEEV